MISPLVLQLFRSLCKLMLWTNRGHTGAKENGAEGLALIISALTLIISVPWDFGEELGVVDTMGLCDDKYPLGSEEWAPRGKEATGCRWGALATPAKLSLFLAAVMLPSSLLHELASKLPTGTVRNDL